jgi:low-affinity inorganic phosphate transporter
MVFSMLLAAIIWNLGTWYFGLPASSSHTLIGAIIGVGLTNALMTHTSVVDALNVPKMIGIFLSLLISPLVGMMVAGSDGVCLAPLLEWHQETPAYAHDTCGT